MGEAEDLCLGMLLTEIQELRRETHRLISLVLEGLKLMPTSADLQTLADSIKANADALGAKLSAASQRITDAIAALQAQVAAGSPPSQALVDELTAANAEVSAAGTAIDVLATPPAPTAT